MKYDLPFVLFESTRDCNLQCRFCYNFWNGKDANDAQSKSNFTNAQRTLKKLFDVARVGHVTFSGGEPLLCEGLEELVLWCSMHGSSVSIISNGTIGDPIRYKLLKSLGVSLVQFPLHSGIPAIHDSLTTVQGSWAKSFASLKAARDLDIPVVAVFVITSLNAGVAKETFQIIQNAGISQIMLARFNIGGRGRDEISRLLPTVSELSKVFHCANQFASTGKVKITANVCLPHCVFDSSETPYIRFLSCSPTVKGRPFTIDYLGNVRMCNHSPVLMGNVFKMPIEEILSTGYAKEWEIPPRACSHCDRVESCRGGCRAAAQQIGGTLDDCDPVVDYYCIKTAGVDK